MLALHEARGQGQDDIPSGARCEHDPFRTKVSASVSLQKSHYQKKFSPKRTAWGKYSQSVLLIEQQLER